MPYICAGPKRQDGQKIPKWKPQSRQTQYLGASPLYASSVELVHNLHTGNISPQFHVVYDDFFETVYATPEQEPPEWHELVIFQSHRLEMDDDTYVPQLDNEWLTKEELTLCQIEQAERRKRGDNKLQPEQFKLPPE